MIAEFLQSQTPQPYPAPLLDTASGVCKIAKRLSLIGFVLPFVGPAGIVLGIFGRLNGPQNSANNTIAKSAIATGIFSTFINPLVLCVMFLLPSLCSAREPANRIKCSSNMRKIGYAIIQYAYDNHDMLPPDLHTLMVVEDLAPEMFTCPSSNTDRLDLQSNPNAHLVEGSEHCSYFLKQYLNKHYSSLQPEDIIIYESYDDHDNDGLNVLYADGHVEWLDRNEGKKLWNVLHPTTNPSKLLSTLTIRDK